jgi:hypothetical protein
MQKLFGGDVSGMGLAGENNLHGTPVIMDNLSQAF